MDYHSKLSRGHKPDYYQLGTADFKPFDRSEDDSTVIERIITELTKTDQIKQKYGSQLRRLMKKVSDEFMIHPTMAAAVVANIIDSEARKSPGAGAARLSLGQMLDDMEEDVQHPKQYAAPEGSKRDKQLDQTQKDLKRAKDLRKQGKAKQADELEQRAYRRRERMEKKARNEVSEVLGLFKKNKIQVPKELTGPDSDGFISASQLQDAEKDAKDKKLSPIQIKGINALFQIRQAISQWF